MFQAQGKAGGTRHEPRSQSSERDRQTCRFQYCLMGSLRKMELMIINLGSLSNWLRSHNLLAEDQMCESNSLDSKPMCLIPLFCST